MFLLPILLICLPFIILIKNIIVIDLRKDNLRLRHQFLKFLSPSYHCTIRNLLNYFLTFQPIVILISWLNLKTQKLLFVNLVVIRLSMNENLIKGTIKVLILVLVLILIVIFLIWTSLIRFSED